eukprot:NODE_4234_length_820_cov_78.567100_g4076_i0.p1 GENE.NODE_4234_length_820_cov_78.567100_g4076_i0~~NODE_4234_length_820_cov_78.567100_g4076_i0.p1  ORF type:complete len:243 (-),score=60.39 NODE_4234_length_820_cov_78.567100_g4076_i0:91-783(-)
MKDGTSEDQLIAFFQPYGEVESCNIPVGRDGAKRLFAFVTIQARELQPKLKLGQHLLNGKQVAVREYLTEGKDGVLDSANCKKVYVGGLPDSATEEHLKTVFVKHGPLDSVAVKYDHTGQPRGFAFVTYTTSQSARAACTATNVVNGVKVVCSPKIAEKNPKVSKELQRQVRVHEGKEAPEAKELARKASLQKHKEIRAQKRKAARALKKPADAEGASDAKVSSKKQKSE